MVRQVVSIHCGQAGLRCGCSFWELLLAEQGLDYEGLPVCPEGLAKSEGNAASHNPLSDCFFLESETGRRVPRCALLDLDSEIHDEIAASCMGLVFSPYSMVKGKEGGGCLYPRGRRLGSADPIRGMAEEAIRVQLEAADITGGILCMRSVGGGSGSGFGEEVLSILANEAPKVPLLETVVWPATQAGNHPAKTRASRLASQSASCVEPYNALLSTARAFERGGASLFLDNGAVSSVLRGALPAVQPYTKDLNQIIAQALASVTLSLRFPSASTFGLSDLLANSVPLPSLSCLSVSYAPLIARDRSPFYRGSTKDITHAVFKQEHSFFSAIQSEGMFLTANLLYRGDVYSGEIQESLLSVKQQKAASFVDWIPTAFKASLSPVGPLVEAGGSLRAPNRACCLIANHTANALQIKRTVEDAKKMLAKRAFVFRYVGEGLEEGEFTEAIEGIQSVFDAYEEAEVVYEYYYPDEEEGKEGEEDAKPQRTLKLDHSLVSDAATAVGDDDSPMSAASAYGVHQNEASKTASAVPDAASPTRVREARHPGSGNANHTEADGYARSEGSTSSESPRFNIEKAKTTIGFADYKPGSNAGKNAVSFRM